MEISPEYTHISFNEAMKIFAASSNIHFYESYNDLYIGAMISGKYYIDDDKDYFLVQYDESYLRTYRDAILSYLPTTKIETFGYTSRFPSKIRHDALTDIPESLKFIHLEHCKGLSEYIIQLFINNNVGCQFVDENIDNDEFIEIDDSGKYILVNKHWTCR